MMTAKFRLLLVILGFVSSTDAIVQVVRTDLGSPDRSGSFLPSEVDANTISLIQYLENGGGGATVATGSRHAPEVSASRDHVALIPLSLFPVPRGLVSRSQGKRDRAYIGRRSGRSEGRTYIGRRKRNSPFDGWKESAEEDSKGRGRVPDGLATPEDLTFIGKREEGKPWYVDFKRARSFIGKRENPLEEYVGEQRGRTPFGKGGSANGNVFVNVPSEVWQSYDLDQKAKRARSYIGKRFFGQDGPERTEDFVDPLTSSMYEEKRGRSFIGKRDKEVFEDKRARSFIGKRHEVQEKHRGALIRKREVTVDDSRGWPSTGKEYKEVQDKRARSFIGKRNNFESDEKMKEAAAVIGKEDDIESEDKRARSFIGKRDDLESEDKRARSFIGKRDDFESEDKRARSFIGKRDDFESEDKRARSFIGKRKDFESEDKRARSFIGKREDFELENQSKRARSFIGKRDDVESEDKRSRSFIGKRDDFESEDKRARSFIGKRKDIETEDKRARSFIGKREDFESEDKRARSFIGKRSNEQSEYMVSRSFLDMTNKTDTDEGDQVQTTDVRPFLNGASGAKVNDSHNKTIENHKEEPSLL